MTTFNACVGLESSKPPEDDNRLLKIKKLKAKLINEEHRLVLMKKIRQSQTRPVVPQQAVQNNINNNNNNSNNTNSSNFNNSAQSNLGQMKKLRPPQAGPLALQKNQFVSPSHQGSTSLNQTPAHAHQRPKVNTLWNPPQQARHPPPVGIAPPHVGNLSRQPITTPPNVVQAMMGNLTGPQSLLINQINAAAARRPHQQSQQSPQQQQPSFSKSQAQMLMQKRPAFKPSIQKQIEQTLIQQHQPQKFAHQSGLGFSSNLSKRSAGITSPHVGNLSRQPITTPPNVVQDMRGGLSGQQSLLMNANNLSSTSRRQSQQQPQSSFNKSTATQMLLQKRTAAKSAIQKQLEQTLMQLPQKHIQLGIDFLPNGNNIEFVYYVGLEACVDYLTNTKNPLETQPLEKPFECSTCGTDFTPSWSWKRSNAVCENCVSNHVKKSIRNSQTSRIKSVLAKAAKQEIDMDQRIMAEAANVVSSPSTVSQQSQQPPQQQQHQPQQHSLLQPLSHQPQRSTSQPVWPRINSSPLNAGTSTRSANVPPVVAPPAPNPLAAGLSPAALTSLLQMNPQLSTLASLMTANSSTTTNNSNQFAQVAALLMNQLSMNLWKR